ncbi:MAG: hypothetical protein KatS3mg131_3252 [Candidatus Tectimicrobiota bacterium]|nr:MAG: hypothetical protein KatS3mg131_3252 [Candidatus Tectomicrobia bacterium]
MRLLMLSYHAEAAAEAVARAARLFQALARQGHQVVWIAAPVAPEVATALGLRAQPQRLPPTCRYVLPCQAYSVGRLCLYALDAALWQQPALHTRLFTFLCLLQRARPGDLLHVWGDFPAPYLGVYTARVLGLPAVVTYRSAAVPAEAQQAFAWRWTLQHTRAALVGSAALGRRLVGQGLPAPRVRVLPTATPRALLRLYGSLCSPAAAAAEAEQQRVIT